MPFFIFDTGETTTSRTSSSSCLSEKNSSARLTSAFVLIISFGVETSTTAWTWMCWSYILSLLSFYNDFIALLFIIKITAAPKRSLNGGLCVYLYSRLTVPNGGLLVFLQDILKHVSKREFEELMCAEQLTRERHKRKAFFNFSKNLLLFSQIADRNINKCGYTTTRQKNTVSVCS